MTTKGLCAVDSCHSVRYARGWCCKHYRRWKTHGDPLRKLRGSDPALVAARFWSKVRQDGDCWVWTGFKSPDGYGKFRAAAPSRRMLPAHRVAYEWMVADIPDGLTIDHLCRNRACVNPYHMEPVPHLVNFRRGTGPQTLREHSKNCAAQRTHCPQGHPYDNQNTYVAARGGRECRTCDRNRHQAARRKRAAQPPMPPQSRPGLTPTGPGRPPQPQQTGNGLGGA